MSRHHAEYDPGADPSILQRVGLLVRKLVRATLGLFAGGSRPSASRRALLQGRLWKLSPVQRYAPLVTRIPTPTLNDEAKPTRSPKTIAGIAIEPVPATEFSQGSASDALSPSTETIPVHRPPGAVNELQFMAGCTRCGDCIKACPHDAIHLAPARLGAVADTPVIDVDASPCLMCEDFPCIDSCQPGVLVTSIPPVMGTARVTAHLCLAYHQTTCTVCVERCPVEDAIVVVDGKPTIDEEVCTGCGVCRYVCPAPENAILHMPAFQRPGWNSQ